MHVQLKVKVTNHTSFPTVSLGRLGLFVSFLFVLLFDCLFVFLFFVCLFVR